MNLPRMKQRRLRAGSLVALAAVSGLLIPSPTIAASAPQTTVVSGPSGLISSRSATFRFKSSLSGSTFACKLDKKRWSRCTSPKRYSRLGQGAHTFRVKAKKNGKVDRTPAVRAFTVDSVKPDTTIDGATTRLYFEDFEAIFSSSEAGTFRCRVDEQSFAPCTSPHHISIFDLVPDRIYTFEVRARDEAGNVDATPATRPFGTVPQMSYNQETGDAAAAFHLPDQLIADVEASCGGSIAVDCPGGQPLPPADQISIASTRTVVKVDGAQRFDVSVAMSVETLQPIKITISGADCDLTLDSGAGASPTWNATFQMPIQARDVEELDAPHGERYMSSTNHSVTGVEDDDWELSGAFICSFGDFFSSSQMSETFQNVLEARMPLLCMAPGPAFLEACPWSPPS